MYLESFFMKKENLIKALEDKLFVSEKELAHFSSVVNKIMTSSQKLNEIINSTKSFGDKRRIGFKEDVSTSMGTFPKFFKSTIPDTKSKSVGVVLKYKQIITFQLSSYSKVNTSHATSSSHHTNSDLLPLPNSFCYVYHHCNECGHLRPNYEKLTSHSLVRVNVSIGSSSPPQSQRPRFSYSFARLCHLYGTTSHIARWYPKYVKSNP